MAVGVGHDEGRLTEETGRRPWLDRFIPESIRNGAPEARQSAHLIVLAAAVAAIWGPLVSLYVARIGGREIALVVATIAMAVVLAPLFLRVTGSVIVSANLLLVAVYGIVLLGASVQAGIAAPSLSWLGVLPIGAFLLAGRPSGFVWVAICVATTLGCYWAAVHGGAHWQNPVEQAAVYPSIRTFNLLAILSVVTAVTSHSLRERERALKDMTRARDAAESATEAKTRFLASMSHEIRTPLNGALGMADLLVASELGEEQRRYAETIQSCGRFLLALLDDVLDFSRIEAGRVDLRPAAFDVRRLVDEVLAILEGPARAKGLHLSHVVLPEVPRLVRTDPDRLRQILFNLLTNAIKFTEAGSVTLEVGAGAAAAGERANLRIEVRDTGIGIRPDRLDRMFERFERADDSMTRRQGGAGLGLAICAHLAELLGGDIGAESQPGSGSRFWLTLPFDGVEGYAHRGSDAVPEGCGSEPIDGVGAATAGCPADGPRARILLVEDNPVNQLVATGMLERLGHRVDVAADGRSALAALERDEFAAVLMDCQMPDLDGFEVTRELRRRETKLGGLRRRVPVIALTASALVGDRRRCLGAGMDDYLPKPIGLAQLAAVLEFWLTRPPESYRTISLLRTAALEEIAASTDGASLVRLIDTYLSATPRYIDALRKSVGDGDAEALWRTAHAFRADSASLGADLLAAYCWQLEVLGRQRSTDGAGVLLEALGVCHRATRRALMDERRCLAS